MKPLGRTKLSKQRFISKLQALYREANYADSDQKSEWTHPDMAGKLCCRHIDLMMSDMLESGVLTEADYKNFHDTL